DAEPQVLIDPVRRDDLPGIHLAAGIPDRLELPERVDELGSVHLRKELRLRLAVAVLAGERAAVRDDERRRLVHERFVFLDALRRLEIEIDPRVNAALAEVSVQRAAV